mmetsp:Transcript_45658/g.108538  ORF Transcript_45658/g.108538 Transcript_45658/m.108538 type:complete len:458 (+) Transcript_45658:873-2246(+)
MGRLLHGLFHPGDAAVHGLARWEAELVGAVGLGATARLLCPLAQDGRLGATLRGPAAALLQGSLAHVPPERPLHEPHRTEGRQRLAQPLQAVPLPLLLLHGPGDVLCELADLQDEPQLDLVVELLLRWWILALLPQLDLQIFGFARLVGENLLHLLAVVDGVGLVGMAVEAGTGAYLHLLIQQPAAALVKTPETVQDLLHSKVTLQLLHGGVQGALDKEAFSLVQHGVAVHHPVVGVLTHLVVLAQLLDELFDAWLLVRIRAVRPLGDGVRMKGALPDIFLLGEDAVPQRHGLISAEDVELLLVLSRHLLQGLLLVLIGGVRATFEATHQVHVDDHVEALSVHGSGPEPVGAGEGTGLDARPLSSPQHLQEPLAEQRRREPPHLYHLHGERQRLAVDLWPSGELQTYPASYEEARHDAGLVSGDGQLLLRDLLPAVSTNLRLAGQELHLDLVLGLRP